MFLKRFKAAVVLAIALARAATVVALDDLPIYTDGALASGWENWSWSSTINFAATDLFEGTSSISITSDAWAAVSLKLEGTFSSYAGLRFDIAVRRSLHHSNPYSYCYQGANPGLQIYFESTVDGTTSPTIPLSAFGQTITADKFTSLLVDFKALPGTGVPLVGLFT